MRLVPFGLVLPHRCADGGEHCVSVHRVEFVEWLVLAGTTIGAAVLAYLTLYRGFPRVLARCATATLPEDQKGYARTELAIWAYEDRHGSAHAAIRREFHGKLDNSEDVM